jgi:hypothetical protein
MRENGGNEKMSVDPPDAEARKVMTLYEAEHLLVASRLGGGKATQ